MNAYLVIAAAIVILVAAAHSLLGERYILVRLFRRDNLPRIFGSDVFTKRTLRFAWHITSVAWLGLAALLLLLSRGTQPSRSMLLHVIAVTSFCSALVVLGGSRGRHLAWVAFTAIALLTWIAA